MKIDFLGTFLFALVTGLIFFAYLATPVCSVLELDPAALFLKHAFQHKTFFSIPMTMFRFFSVPCCIQGCYFICMVMCVVSLLSFLGLESGKHLYRISPRLTRSKELLVRLGRLYNSLKIVTQALDDFASPLMFFIQSAGICFSAIVCYTTIRILSFLPPLFQLTAVISTILTFVAIHIFLPMVSQIYELSVEGLAVEKRKISQRFKGKVRKELLMSMRARAPCKVHLGLFGYHLYFNKRSTITVYYKTIQDCVLTAVLS